MHKTKGPEHDQVLRATKQNTNTDIISLKEWESKMKNKVTVELGYEPATHAYRRAYLYANRKLKWQSEKYNKIFDDNYKVKVIAETYEQQAMMDYINKGGWLQC